MEVLFINIRNKSLSEIVSAIFKNGRFRINQLRHEIRENRYEYYRKKESKRLIRSLKNDSFTILCQNCTGGYMYGLLGKRFDSPTINLYILQSDFVKFCLDLSYYLEQELRFFINEDDTSCPYAHLGYAEKEITIAFTHYSTEDEAKEKWDMRKKRIHYDNLYIVTNDGNGVTP